MGIRVARLPVAAKLFLVSLASSSDPSASSGTSALGLSAAMSICAAVEDVSLITSSNDD